MNFKYIISATLFSLIIITGSCGDFGYDDETDEAKKYLGTWSVSDQSARINYTVTIVANPSNSAEILLNNFADLGSKAVALVIGNSLAIDSQPLGSGYTVAGSGSYINKDKLQFSFDLNDGIDNEARVATFTR